MSDESMGEIIGAILDASAGDDFSGDDFSGDDFSGEDFNFSGEDFSGDDASAMMTLAGAIMKARRKGGGGAGRGGNMKQQIARAISKGLQGRNQITRRDLYAPPVYTRSRTIPLGFDSVTAVPAGAVVTITQRPQVPFKPDRFFVPSDIAGAFLIQDIKVGNKSQMAAQGALPARMFQEDAVGTNLILDVAQTSMDVVILAQNISVGALRFFASVIGPAVEQLPAGNI